MSHCHKNGFTCGDSGGFSDPNAGIDLGLGMTLLMARGGTFAAGTIMQAAGWRADVSTSGSVAVAVAMPLVLVFIFLLPNL